MYYPYLRARQFELIALRELALENKLSKITPVLEPVKSGFNNLNIAHKVFQDKNQNAFLIVNPFQGEKAGDGKDILDYIYQLNDSKYIVAFHYMDNSDYINRFIKEYNINECMIICLDNISDEDGFKTLSNHVSVSHIMLLEPNKYRSLDRYIKSLNKKYIRLDDVFPKQQRNADYLDILAHKLTEEHLFYKEDNYSGFSDFTVLTSEYIEGGSTPRAVVIHLSYLNREAENQIWVRHFTSNSNDSIANVQGKFAEAASKAVEFCNTYPLNNSAIVELSEIYNEERYPGLGTVKKISIKNHLLVIDNYLNN